MSENDTQERQMYFHELDRQQVEKLIADNKSIEFILKNYKQPKWCTYPNALAGEMGCWSLMDIYSTREQISEQYCSICDCYSKESK